MTPEITSKSDELLQAQVATYAAEELDKTNGDHLLNGLGSMALHEQHQKPLVLMTETTRVVSDGDTGFFKSVSVREEKTVADPTDHARFLRERGGSHYGPVHARAELLKQYKNFKPEVTAIQREFQNHTFYDEHPNHLGSGMSVTGTLLEKDGRQYVMRSFTADPLKASDVDHYASRIIRGRGLPHFEQLAALSYEEGVLISERMPGKQIEKLSPVELNQEVSDQQLDELVDSLLLAVDHGIEIDPKNGNTFYDKTEGFGFIDYIKVANPEKHISNHIDWASSLLVGSGSSGDPQSLQECIDALPLVAAEIALTERFEAACRRRLSEEEYAQSIPRVLERRNGFLKRYADYSDPQWFAQHMVNLQRRQTARAEIRSRNPVVNGRVVLDEVM